MKQQTNREFEKLVHRLTKVARREEYWGWITSIVTYGASIGVAYESGLGAYELTKGCDLLTKAIVALAMLKLNWEVVKYAADVRIQKYILSNSMVTEPENNVLNFGKE